ncbi:MAG: thiol:disulfide interchange protein DsbA/DsbL [Sulfurimicrobium sp.]|jgi:thiol:disulfide interchange protein DsbA|nr:thiol:disulfide interchange protein DsbA/DsbL [Sulfurimicrobium sp.]MDP1703181.1 thiol:disulfide interchange protein DsbA/DsbL [Sulfurimicrobium sp.]MDP1896590.1 thiol:disulfide interchange protein DsbA/DsbL [Sulfurimicrobium sp.]MDP2197674.1 thiol:disulfide interchange protein DsbA/DsbL [Sulfurimicrobium sp.]MDP2964124.1 thiol:disulfide interchange protein DsbA/DsbL [Sulfurimicrobium sp.]
MNLAFLRMLFATLCLSLLWSASARAELELGKQYVLVSPVQQTESGKNVEVLEFFSYACPHCHELEPVLNPWVKKLPGDVTFRRMPAVFSDKWLVLARVFYTAEALGQLDRLHPAIFNAMHVDRLDLTNEKTLQEWVGRNGIEAKKFMDTYNSFAVQGKAQRAKQLTRAFAVTGVPALVVDGKYMTSASQTGGNEKLLPVLDDLIKKARQERGGKS